MIDELLSSKRRFHLNEFGAPHARDTSITMMRNYLAKIRGLRRMPPELHEVISRGVADSESPVEIRRAARRLGWRVADDRIVLWMKFGMSADPGTRKDRNYGSFVMDAAQWTQVLLGLRNDLLGEQETRSVCTAERGIMEPLAQVPDIPEITVLNSSGEEQLDAVEMEPPREWAEAVECDAADCDLCRGRRTRFFS